MEIYHHSSILLYAQTVNTSFFYSRGRCGYTDFIKGVFISINGFFCQIMHEKSQSVDGGEGYHLPVYSPGSTNTIIAATVVTITDNIHITCKSYFLKLISKVSIFLLQFSRNLIHWSGSFCNFIDAQHFWLLKVFHDSWGQSLKFCLK